MAVYSDSFDRADGPIGIRWQDATGAMAVFSNLAYGDTNAGEYDFSWWRGLLGTDFFAPNQYSEAPLANASTGAAWWLEVRAVGTGASFVAYAMLLFKATAQVIVYRIDPGPTPAQLAVLENSTVFTNGDVYRISVDGDTIRGYRNGVELGSGAIDTGLTSGAAGIGCLDTNEGWASWEGGDIQAGQPRFLLMRH